MMTIVAFWTLAILACYSYALYPLLLFALGSLVRDHSGLLAFRGGRKHVTIIVAAYNESARIREKLENIIALQYPAELLQRIVASDCSSDGTDDIVREYCDGRVWLVRSNERLGKENAQQCALGTATGDVIVFSDVATRIPPDALWTLVRYFDDPSVGAVSSEDRFISPDGSMGGEGAYVRYEMWLRRTESRLAGLVGLSGSFFAARRSVCAEWDIHSPSDFNTALNCAKLGLRAVTAPDVLGFYSDLKDQRKEYQRKVRTVVRGMTAIARHTEVLNVARFGLFAVQVWSHKLMRWLVPWLLVLLLGVNLLLLGRPFFQLCLAAQLAVYGVAAAAHVSASLKRQQLARIVYFFVQANLAVAEAGCRFVAGRRMTTWQPSAR